MPGLIEGERTHHYDIDLPSKLQQVLIGTLSVEGIFTLLFFPKKRKLLKEEINAYRSVYIDFTRAVTEMGITPKACTDEVTVQLLKSSGVFTNIAAPLLLSEIAAYDRSTPRNS